MWLEYYQPLVTDLVQKALVQLCNDHVPHDGKLEIDGIVCISNGSLDKQIVVKVHEVIGTGKHEQNTSSRSRAHILQVPGFKRRGDTSETSEQPVKQQKTEVQLSPRSTPLNLSQNHSRERARPVLKASDNNNGGAKDFSNKDPKKMSISLLKLLSSDQPTERLSFVNREKDNTSPGPPESQYQQVVSPSSSRECSPVSDAVLAKAKCKICSKSVPSVHQLVGHTADVHKRHLCKHCLNSFSLRCNLHRHERLHSGIKPFPCSQCGKSFARNADLKLHMQKHDSGAENEPANTTCQKCSKVFINVHSLRYHLFKVHRVQDGIYACTICEKVFDDEDVYNKHWESHTDSLVQHGQIKVTLKPKPLEDSEDGDIESSPMPKSDIIKAVKENNERGTTKVSPGKTNRNVTFKSLLQPKFKPIAFPKEKHPYDDEKNPDVKTEPKTGDVEKELSSQDYEVPTSLSDSNIPDSDLDSQGQTAEHSSSGIDFDAIKKEFGPLFRYSEMNANGRDSDDDDQSDDLTLSMSLNIPSLKGKGGSSPALSDSIPNHVSSVSKNKRKSRPVKHITDSLRYESDDYEGRGSPNVAVSAEPQSAFSPIVNTSKRLMSGATLIQMSADVDKPLDDSTPRDQSQAESSYEKKSANSASKPKAGDKKQRAGSDSPSVTPKAKLKTIPGVDKEPQGSPSAEVLADDELNYECRYGGCGQKFIGFKLYEDHFFCAHGRFPCKLCDQSFTCKNNRTRHIRNHLGIAKRHSCDRCTKTFTRPDTLQEHKFIHTQSYKADHCNSCGASFDRKALLLAHMKKCFRNKPELLEKDMLDSVTEAAS